MQPMAVTGQEAVGSMGSDTPISALSDKSKLLYTYFKQNFAQVTNPPIDPIREELVMSLVSFIGPRPNILDLEGTSRRKRLEVRQPILTNEDLEKIRCIGHFEDRFDTKTLDITYDAELGAAALDGALDRLCDRAEAPVHGGYNIIILSDRMVGPDRIPIPALLATAAVHNYLIRKGLRTSVGTGVESASPGDPSLRQPCGLRCGGDQPSISPSRPSRPCTRRRAAAGSGRGARRSSAYIKSIGKGLLKVMSKMGISTYQSYCGAQIFDAIGLSPSSSTATSSAPPPSSRASAWTRWAEENVRRHRDAFGDAPDLSDRPRRGGEYAYRTRGEVHAWNPDTVATLQHAVRLNAGDRYREFAKLVNEQENELKTIRGLFRIKLAPETGRAPLRWTRWNPPRASCGASPRAPCPSGRSPRRRTRPLPSP
jgi:glutamate synthase (NADPH/NADH) large chain